MAKSVSYDEVGRQLAEDMKERIEEEGLVASGAMLNSVSYTIDGSHITIEALPYAQWAANGRPAGNVQYNFRDIILAWVRTKGINLNGTKPETFAFLTARKIRNEGSKRYRDDNPADITSEPIQKAVDTIGEIFIESIKDMIINNGK